MRLALAFVLVATAAGAQGYRVSEDEIVFAPEDFTGFTSEVWGLGAPQDRSPGPFLGFRGVPVAIDGRSCAVAACDSATGAACTDQIHAGDQSLPAAFSSAKTGLAAWADDVTMPRCPDGPAFRGDTFGAWSGTPDGGIALYSATGLSSTGNRPAWLQTAGGKTTSNIQGTFATFSPLYARPWFRPFAGAADCADADCRRRYAMEISTTQAVAAHTDNGCADSFQNFQLVLRNTAGTDALADDGLLQLQMTTFCDFRRGCRTNSRNDPNQGGLRWIAGNFGAAGDSTRYTVKRPEKFGGGKMAVELWRSQKGEMGGGASMPSRDFEAVMTWDDLVGMLRATTFASSRDGGADAAVAELYRPGWDDPANWIVSRVRFGQEISDENWRGDKPECGPRVTLGGSMSRFRLARTQR